MSWGKGQGKNASVIEAEEDVALATEASEEHPDGYCATLGCWCHTNAAYHAVYTGLSEPTASDLARANTFFGF